MHIQLHHKNYYKPFHIVILFIRSRPSAHFPHFKVRLNIGDLQVAFVHWQFTSIHRTRIFDYLKIGRNLALII